MSVKVAINGFGRIGRLAFRQMFGAEGYDVVAINDLTKPSMLAHLLKYDTAQGGYCGKMGENLHTVTADDEAGTITVDGKTLKIYAKADAKELPWGEIGVDVVLNAQVSTAQKIRARLTLMLVLKKLLFLLLQVTTSKQSFSALTKILLQLMIQSSLLHLAQQTALHLWQKLLTIMLQSKAVS